MDKNFDVKEHHNIKRNNIKHTEKRQGHHYEHLVLQLSGPCRRRKLAYALEKINYDVIGLLEVKSGENFFQR